MSRAYPSVPFEQAPYRAIQSLPELWSVISKQYATVLAVHDPHSNPEIKLTYAQLYEQMQWFAAGIQALEIRTDAADRVPPRIALFSDNCPRWLIADQGIMRSGAVDVVRGAQADPLELRYILEHSGSVGVVLQDAELLKKLRPILAEVPLQFVILLTDETATSDTYKVMNFSEVINLGKSHTLQPVQQNRQTLATLMYTSGTSGMPKGVMLSHGNLLYEVNGAYAVAKLEPGERVLSILPIWHSYERTFEYFIFSNGCTQIYTNIRFVKKDIKDHRPHYMVGVPRLWESIYEGIQKQFRDQPAKKQKLVKFFLGQSQKYILAKRTAENLNLDHLDPSGSEKLMAKMKAAVRYPFHKLGDRLVYEKVRQGTGGCLKFVVSGGGSIAEHLEDFFEIVGINILGGYGLTETSPITHARRPWRNVRGADGEPLPGTETRIVDPETRKDLPIGQRGLILLRGHQIMQGYFKNPEATAKAIDPQGWFDTGDLGMVTRYGDLVITGRAKDTIVLTNGENIEPQPIEDACLRSPYVDQIMLVGQDQKVLGALVVPNIEALEQWKGGTVTLQDPAVQDLFRQELTKLVKERPGYRPDDRIGNFRLLSEPFTMENGLLTQTLKIRRNVVMERYQGMIDEMFSQ
ncbi:AMP-dependent synthetase/ligase [Leptolyngbya sp. AN03gr2]|uniref:AMP-dependent synthetase/ligase n=1 Tax=unclassified Leptolyngbya TaxID=2650499 RepID=UPI003D31D873